MKYYRFQLGAIEEHEVEKETKKFVHLVRRGGSDGQFAFRDKVHKSDLVYRGLRETRIEALRAAQMNMQRSVELLRLRLDGMREGIERLNALIEQEGESP